jgi:hypothetical protein
MNDLERARAALEDDKYSVVLYKGGLCHTSFKRGIAPLLDWLEGKTGLEGFSAADRIVGKAAALLYVLMGVKAVFAEVMSEKAGDFVGEWNTRRIPYACAAYYKPRGYRVLPYGKGG